MYAVNKQLNFGLAAIVAVLLLTMPACKKQHVCTCSYTGFGGQTQTETSAIPDASRKEARETCEGYETILRTSFADASCSLN